MTGISTTKSKKIRKKQRSIRKSARKAASDNKIYLHIVARQMLEKLQDILDCIEPGTPVSADIQSAYTWFFGTKHSPVSALSMIAELIMALEEESEPKHALQEIYEEDATLSSNDMTIMEEFLKKQRKSEA